MLINILKILFALVAISLVFMIIGLKWYVSKIKDNMKKSDYIAVMAILFFLYVIIAFILALFLKGWTNKIVMILFAISPFIIGRIATFKTEHFYSTIQMLVFFLSFEYICII